MPGIVGIISRRPAHECQALVNSMVASMEHERFYVAGSCYVPEMGVYSGWVAMENSHAAGQVFFDEQREIALLFAGEFFCDLERHGERTQEWAGREADATSWLIRRYQEDGDRFVEKLNGLFSGLLIDKRQRKAFLFNDRYGIERIYCHETEDAMFFASEAKALLRILPELREFDVEGVAQFLTFGCTLGGRTFFRGIEFL